METRPATPVHPELVAFGDRPYRHRIGLRPTDVWLDRDVAHEYDVTVKVARHAAEPERVRLELPGSEEAAAVVAAAVAEVTGAPTEDDDPLLGAGLGIQEDLVVLEPRAGEWRFTSGLVCFPTAWEPAEKLGLPVLAIHDPVPEYAAQIGAAVDSTIDRLRTGDLRWRRNWSLTTTPDLWLPPDTRPGSVEDVGRDVWLRIERQTLLRLNDSVIVFGIRIHRWRLAEAVDARSAAALATTIRTMSPEVRSYKELLATHTDQLLDWLELRAAGAA